MLAVAAIFYFGFQWLSLEVVREILHIQSDQMGTTIKSHSYKQLSELNNKNFSQNKNILNVVHVLVYMHLQECGIPQGCKYM